MTHLLFIRCYGWNRCTEIRNGVCCTEDVAGTENVISPAAE